MTPTEQDKELRELQEFIKSCFGMEPEEDWYDYYRYDDRVRIRDFITADRKRVALEARLDELELWASIQPSGQRVKDLVKFAKEILDAYPEI